MTDQQISTLINELQLLNTQIRVQNDILKKALKEIQRQSSALVQLSSALTTRG